MSESNFRNDLKLDQYDLVTCALNQPDLFAKYALEWADAVKLRDNLKDNMALIRGECDQEIRETPSEFGWQKIDKAPTEAFISSAIGTHKDYLEANDAYQDAQHQVNVLTVAKEAFDQRRRMIEVLVQLYTSNYYSGNKKLDRGYQEVLPVAAEQAQNEGLEKSSRLARRVKTEV